MTMLKVIDWESIDSAEQRRLLQRPAVRENAGVERKTADIVQRVRSGGDQAVRDLSLTLDRVRLNALAVSDREFRAARRALSESEIAAIEFAIANVRKFHEQQIPVDIDVDTAPGVRCQQISHPIESIGLYVPAGSAPLPSTVIMLAVPATIAGCPSVNLCSPARTNGSINPAVLVAAELCGVHRVFKVGGAQAIAAMAYGTETIPRTSKIFGPGNAFVTAAKSLVAKDPQGPSIDLPAGPSEVLVIADDNASPTFVAADLLSQAEHDVLSQVMLVCTSPVFAELVRDQIESQLSGLSRRETIEASLANSAAIVADDLNKAIAIANEYAPEHLILQVERARAYLSSIRNAGSIFLGAWSPESAGDYCSGTNHVLPTYGAARSYSGLGVDQFMRRMTVQELSQEGLQSLAPSIETLASMEGLDAHANAVRLRLSQARPKALAS